MPQGAPTIAMLVHKLDDRAICRLVVDICREMQALGADPILVAATEDRRARLELPPDLRVEVFGARFDRTIFALGRLVSFLRRRRPEVLFAHHGGPARSAVAARVLARVETRIVTVEHNHYSSYVAPRGGGRRLAAVYDRLTRLLYGRAHCVAGVAPEIVEDLQKRFALDASHMTVLPDPGRSAEAIARLAAEPVAHAWYSGTQPRPRIICCVGNLIPRKNQLVLVEALPAVRKAAGDVRLVLVGRADNPDYARRLEARAAALGVSDHLLLAGFDENPIRWMAGADVFALTSVNEGCPRVLSEAMACGIPVVAADCPSGPAFITQDGRCGALVPMGDVPATAASLVRVLSDDVYRRELIQRGRERASDFTPRSVAERYRSVARALVGASAGSLSPAVPAVLGTAH